jgi:hypothetical protein
MQDILLFVLCLRAEHTVVLFCAYMQNILLFFVVKTTVMNTKPNMEMSEPSCNSHPMF